MKHRLSFLIAVITSVICLCFSTAFGAYAAEDVNLGSIAAGETKSVSVEEGSSSYFSFTPEEDGKYAFSSSGNVDTYGYLYLGDEEIVTDDDSGEGNNFKFVYNLEKDNTYRFVFKTYSSSSGSFNVSVEQLDFISASYVPAEPYTVYVNTNGYESGDSYYYYAPSLNDGDKIIVDKKSGEAVYTFSRYEGRFCDENGNKLDYSANGIGYFEGLGATKFDVYIYDIEETFEVPVEIINNPIENIRFTPAEDIQLIENYDGYISDDGEGNDYFYYNYSYNQLNTKGAFITIEYNDGREDEVYTYKTVKIGESDGGYYYYDSGYYNEDNKKLPYSYSFEDNQYYSHWTLGGENYIDFSYLNKTYKIPVSIVENPVESINFTPSKPIVFIENTSGSESTDGDGNNYYNYNFYSYNYITSAGAVLSVKLKEGGHKDYTYGIIRIYDEDDSYHYESGFYDEDGNKLLYTLSYVDNQYENHWVKGGNNYVTVSYLNSTYDVSVEIKENTVDSFSFEFADFQSEYIENNGGYFNTDFEGNSYYYYNTPSLNENGNRITIKRTDGSTDVYTYKWLRDENGNYNSGFYDDADEELEFANTLDTINNQSIQHWTVGGEYNYFNVRYLGKESERINVSVISNPVEEISYKPAKSIELYENIGGEEREDGNGDTYFHYDFESYYYFNTYGSVLTVKYTDGREVEYEYRSYEFMPNNFRLAYVDKDGNVLPYISYVQCSIDQYTSHWTADSDNSVTVSYLGKTCNVPVTIKKIDVTSIKVDAEDIEIMEENEGYNTSGWVEGEQVEYFRYFSKFYKIKGITLVFKDGEPVYYSNTTDDDDDYYVFKAENGDIISTADYLSITDDQGADNPWGVGEHYYTVSYLGFTDKVKVNIVESPIESIVADVKPHELLENYNGEYYDDGDGDIYIYDFNNHFSNGDKLTVKYRGSGTVEYTYREVRVYDEEEDGYYYRTAFYDSEDNIFPYDIVYQNEQYKDPWLAEKENFATFKVLTESFKVPVTIIKNDVVNISYNPANPLEYDEFTNGYMSYSYYLEEDYYCYFIPDIYAEGSSFDIELDSGETVTYVYSGEYRNFVSSDGKTLDTDYIYTTDSQDQKPWTAGGENYFTVSYMGKTCSVPVAVKESQIADFDLQLANNELLQHIDGYYSGSVFHYKDLTYSTGNTLTLYYKSGDTEVYTYRYDEAADENQYVTDDGKALFADFSVDSKQYDEEWDIGEHEIEVSIAGITKKVVLRVVKPDYDLDIDGGAIALDETKTVDLRKGQRCTFTFTPSESGTYDFVSYGNEDTYGYAYYGSQMLAKSDDGHYLSNFKVTCSLEAGKTYTFLCRMYLGEDEGSFTVSVSAHPANPYKASKITVTVNGEANGDIYYSEEEDIVYVEYDGDYSVQEWNISGAEHTVLTSNSYRLAIKLKENTDELFIDAVAVNPGHHHSYTSVVVAPTCEDEGYTLYTCSCGDEYTDDYVPALGHDWGEAEFVWNGYESATATKYCANDVNHILSVEAAIDSETVEATATENGSITYTATAVFSEEGKEDVVETDVKVKTIPATGYTYSFDHFEWAENGKTATAVLVANEDNTFFTYADAEISSAVKAEPTCTEYGTTTYTAAYEDETDTKDVDDIKPLNHDFGGWEITKAAGCLENGEETRYCSRCDVTETREIVAPGHHTPVVDPAVPATYTSVGKTEGSHCEICGEILVEQTTIPMLTPADTGTDTAKEETPASNPTPAADSTGADSAQPAQPAEPAAAEAPKTASAVTKLTLKKVTVKKSAKKLVLQATLKVNGKAVKGKKITFKFNGKKYTAKTNAKGVAKVTIKASVLKKLKVGKKITYQATYSKTTAKKSVKVKK